MAYRPKTEAAQKYAQSLKDPRWISKRDMILSRDGYACRGCGAKDPEPPDEVDSYDDLDPPEQVLLEVHHKYYEWGNPPWEYPNSALITLCQMCHDIETVHSKKAIQQLTRALQTRFLSLDMLKLAHAFECLAMPIRENEKAAKLITWILTERKILGGLEQAMDERQPELRNVGQIADALLSSWNDYTHG